MRNAEQKLCQGNYTIQTLLRICHICSFKPVTEKKLCQGQLPWGQKSKTKWMPHPPMWSLCGWCRMSHVQLTKSWWQYVSHRKQDLCQERQLPSWTLWTIWKQSHYKLTRSWWQKFLGKAAVLCIFWTKDWLVTGKLWKLVSCAVSYRSE